MRDIITYTETGLSAAKTVNIPTDFPYYKRGVSYTEVELTLEGTGTIPAGSTLTVTAKRKGSTDDLTPEDNFLIDATNLPQSVTYFGTFSEITVTPNSNFTGGSCTFKIILNAGETY